MSQSPENATAEPDEVDRYRRGWQAFSRLISEGRSFSGYERNCCFLNLGEGRFADVSSLSNLDYPDDGRAVAVTDWDFDGRLDLWVTNRTSPRLRLLRNDTQNECRFVAVRLRGVSCNRDAIGARVEMYLDNAPDQAVLRQLTAGDGYLAQSTKWIHFGIPSDQQIDRLVVHWPGSKQEIFRGLRAGQHYRLVEGTGKAELWKPPHSGMPDQLARSKPVANDPLRRTVIVGRVEVPDVAYLDWEGRQVSLARGREKAVLVNLWSATCEPCLRELGAWTRQAESIRAAPVEVLALSVDSLLDKTGTHHGKRVLAQLNFPWSSGRAQADLLQTLELLHDQFVQFQRDLPLPSSFLIDRNGRLAVIYKGPLPVEQLLADVAQLDADARTRRASAVPFPGRWASRPFRPDPASIVQRLGKLGPAARASQYARRCIEANIPHSDTALSALHESLGKLLLQEGKLTEADTSFSRAVQLGDENSAVQRRIGEAYLAQNMPKQALTYLKAAIPAHPNDAGLFYNAGIAALASRRLNEAIEHLRRSHKLMPTDVNTCFHLGNALHAAGETDHAIRLYQQALEQKPGWPFATNNLAWILATHADASIRNGPEAVRLAESLCRANDHSDPSSLATLAAAYAEVGRFDDAADANQRAISLAEQRGLTALANRLRDRATVIAQRRAVRDRP